jgi:magnesium chelatase subunit I
MEVIRRRIAFDADPEAYVAAEKDSLNELTEKIEAARKLVKKIPADDDAVRMAAKISMNYNMEGHRADITLIRAARANAALEGRDRITKEGMEAVAALVLAHRVKKRGPSTSPGSTRPGYANAWRRCERRRVPLLGHRRQ